jgi:predicted nucleic acid-binding protein
LSSILVDTNVVVYAYDGGEPKRQAIAERTLAELQPIRLAALSAQVLAEFFRVVTARLVPPIPAGKAYGVVGQLAQSFTIWAVDEVVVLEAARGVRDHRMNYWDAQIWATARLRGARTVLSEDFADGLTIEGVSFVDPFQPAFSLDRLISL